VHGIIYVADISDENRLDENYETIRKVQLHRGTSRKPFLVVLNKKKPTEMDDFDFSRNVSELISLDTLYPLCHSCKSRKPIFAAGLN
ncbi:unnamed protein product, partial [Haemonchus placei]|uniref:NOG1 domain-containing protein n=1 Tax=Haemonchus placei TaxID=6290 RepID=A0A0N4VZI0_HAEPC